MNTKTEHGAQSIDMVWIVVKDVKQAIHYYSDILGLKLISFQEEYGWAELQGESGCMMGIAGCCDYNPIKAGSNAVITLSVKDLEKTKMEMLGKGVKMVGETQEVPGHVKMQTCVDADGNHFQLVQKLGN